MQWIDLQNQAHLVILGDDGNHSLFPYNADADDVLGPSVDSFCYKAHSSKKTYFKGFLSCVEASIISTTGDDVVGRQIHNLSNLGLFCLSVFFSASLKLIVVKQPPRCMAPAHSGV